LIAGASKLDCLRIGSYQPKVWSGKPSRRERESMAMIR
jgi:hypothetical protein